MSATDHILEVIGWMVLVSLIILFTAIYTSAGGDLKDFGTAGADSSSAWINSALVQVSTSTVFDGLLSGVVCEGESTSHLDDIAAMRMRDIGSELCDQEGRVYNADAIGFAIQKNMQGNPLAAQIQVLSELPLGITFDLIVMSRDENGIERGTDRIATTVSTPSDVEESGPAIGLSDRQLYERGPQIMVYTAHRGELLGTQVYPVSTDGSGWIRSVVLQEDLG